MWITIRNLMAGGLVSKVLTGIANILIIKLLSKEDYASVANFQFVQTLMSGLIFSPFLLTSVLGVNLFEMKNMRRLFSALNLIQISLVVLGLLIALIYGEKLAESLFHKPVFYYPLLLGLISSLFLTFQNIVLSGHQASESYGSYNLVNFLRPVALIGLLSGFYLFGKLSFFTAAASFLLSYMLAVTGDLKSIFDSLKFRGLLFRLKQFAWFWKYLKFLILFFFIRAMLDHISRFMVSRYFSVEDNAFFGVAFQYYAMADLLIYSAHVAFMNIFTREPENESGPKYFNWLKISSLLSLPALALLPFSGPLFSLLNGRQYDPAFPVFMVFMAGIVVYLCFSPVIYALAGRKSFRTLFLLSLIALGWQVAMTSYAASEQSLVLMAFACVGARGLIYITAFFLYLRKA